MYQLTNLRSRRFPTITTVLVDSVRSQCHHCRLEVWTPFVRVTVSPRQAGGLSWAPSLFRLYGSLPVDINNGPYTRIMEPDTLARIHLECALRLTNREFLVDWIKASTNTTTDIPTPQPKSHPKSTRGRKPGAADESNRCTWKRTDDTCCKNARTTDSTFCKIHMSKAHLITG